MIEFSNAPMTGRRKMITCLLPSHYNMDFYGSKILDQESLKSDLAEQLPIFERNRRECALLLRYYKGDQPILYRVDENRTEDNHTVINFAGAISRKISSYTYSGGIQYVSEDAAFFDDVKMINRMMKKENKTTVSKEVQDYQSICGTAYVSVLPDPMEKNGVPFELRFLSPVDTFVVYSAYNEDWPVYGCHKFYVKNGTGEKPVYQVYTENEVYLYDGDRLDIVNGYPQGHILGRVPIVEYPNNAFRLGDFEVALTLLDSINDLTSDCMYNIKSVVTSYLCIFGVDRDSVDPEEMRKNRVLVFNGAPGITQSANFIYTQLDGTATDTLRNYLESALKFIAGVPDRDAGQTGSDTGVAAELRTGQGDLEDVAKTKSMYAARAERSILDIVINILQPQYISAELDSGAIDVEITRINRADILTKTQSMLNMQTLGMSDEDIVYFAAITNDVSGVAKRMRENREKKAEEAAAIAQNFEPKQDETE